MEDSRIIELFFERSEQAIIELSAKYGKLFFHVANHILGSREDADECVNDAYLGIWNAIPPHRPNPLRAFACRIVRNVSLKKYRSNSAVKRNSQFDISMEELEDILPSPSVEEIWSARELGRMVAGFLDTLPAADRVMFVRRYWFADSVKELAGCYGLRENTVSVRLSRIRKQLREYLAQEGETTVLTLRNGGVTWEKNI